MDGDLLDDILAEGSELAWNGNIAEAETESQSTVGRLTAGKHFTIVSHCTVVTHISEFNLKLLWRIFTTLKDARTVISSSFSHKIRFTNAAADDAADAAAA